MSLVVNTRDLSVGPTLAPPAYVSSASAAQDNQAGAAAAAVVGVGMVAVYAKRDGEKLVGQEMDRTTSIGLLGNDNPKEPASSDSSSIGVPSDDGGDTDEEDGEEVQSKSNRILGSLTCLEESLPFKRGLSNHFSGKSKSFANLFEVSVAKQMEKKENPLNKKRRLMIANKWSRKSDFYGWRSIPSMPMLALSESDSDEQGQLNGQVQAEKEEEEEEEEEEAEDSSEEEVRDRRQMFKGSKSCFTLVDLGK